MITISDLHKSFGAKQVLRGVNITVAPGSVVGVIGPSGGGKSVLMKILGDAIEADSGSIDLAGTPREDIGLMFQEGALFDSLTVLDNVAFPLARGTVPTYLLPRAERQGVISKIEEILGRVGLLKAVSKTPNQISGGMRRRASLARAVVNRPSILLLDDPTCGLDPVASNVIMNLIRELHADYRPTVIMVSQDLRRLLPAVESVVALFDGQVAFHGSLSELAANGSDDVRAFVRCRYDL